MPQYELELVNSIYGNWNTNSQSFARAKGKFCRSVSVLFDYTTMEKKCSDEILVDKFYIIEYLKRFITAVWLKKWAKLSEGCKLTVKR